MKDNYKRSAGTKNSKGKRGQNQKLSRKSIIKRVLILTVLIGLIFLVLGSMLFAYYVSQAPAFSEEKLRDPVPAQIYDRNDELVTTVYQGQRRESVDIEDVPDHVVDAVLAVEDNRFYEHGAIDFWRLGSAVLSNIFDGFGSEGASTITQQVVKRTFLTDDKSIERKAQEAYLAYRLEQEYSKDEILEMYLNKIYYSDGIYGIRTASQYYFDKELDELNLAEAAYLAGLPQLPNRYNLYVEDNRGVDRAQIVLRLMHEHERISSEEYEEAQNHDLYAGLVERSDEERASTEPENPEFASYINFIKNEISAHDSFRNVDISELMASGIEIYTNMDAGIQRNLQNLTDNRDYYYNPKFQSDDFDIASTILDTQTGELVAISGGRDYQEVVDHNQALVPRNVGSTMKPFLAYGPAIEELEWRTDQTIEDEYEYSPEGIDHISIYNYDMQDHGQVTIREALSRSYNIPAVKAYEIVKDEAGGDAPREFAEEIGFDYNAIGEGDYEVSFNDVLGGRDSAFTPLQMAEAYSALGNNGEYNSAHAVRHVVTNNGDTVEFEHESEQVMEDYTAYMLTDILKDTFEPYGSADYIYMDGLNIAAKTGTTSYSRELREEQNLPDNAAKDAWIVGYTPEYTMSVWTGFTATEEGGETSFVGTDEHITPQWFFRDIMQSISTYNGQDFEQPDSVIRLSNGELAVQGSEDFEEYEESGSSGGTGSGGSDGSNGDNGDGGSSNTWNWSWGDGGDDESDSNDGDGGSSGQNGGQQDETIEETPVTGDPSTGGEVNEEPVEEEPAEDESGNGGTEQEENTTEDAETVPDDSPPEETDGATDEAPESEPTEEADDDAA
ncbi:transglycosylase domain-containing protein [Salinicoccus halitifaciens]|uniref:Penicillin-binding protein 1A n=1 Tax=Salinicoccus halitifaciens TaxID=1073415 RepID=A0ABV2E6B6_9STAP|nr:transglycosylase domain-containing protein [Salinicoccus halitifaciens]MCD2136984.1 penicillin-binding protein [Salinicoccus halitifaciens]